MKTHYCCDECIVECSHDEVWFINLGLSFGNMTKHLQYLRVHINYCPWCGEKLESTGKKINKRIGNLEFRHNGKDSLSPEYEIVEWMPGGTCMTIVMWVETGDPCFEVRFISSRPIYHICGGGDLSELWELIQYGDKIANEN